MAVTVDFYSHSKNYNSTQIPNPAKGTYARFHGEMNVGCSVLNPTIVIDKSARPYFFKIDDVDSEGSPFDDDYLWSLKIFYIFQFHRWYFITDVTYDSGFWYISGTVDVLATYKDTILNSTQLVSRSQSRWNATLIDGLVPVSGNVARTVTEIPKSNFGLDDVTSSSGLYYVVTMAGNDEISPRGMVTPYVLNYRQLKDLKRFMMNNPSYVGEIQDVTPNMFKALFNPMQYIVSCKAFNFQPYLQPDSEEVTIKFGYWDTGIQCLGIASGNIHSYGVNLSIPKNTYAKTGYTYRNFSPFRKLIVHFMPFYHGEIDSALLPLEDKIHLGVRIDPLSGSGQFEVSRLDGLVLMQTYCNYGIDIPVSQMLSDYFGEVVARSNMQASLTAFSSEILNTKIDMNKLAYGNMYAGQRDTVSYAQNVVSGVGSALTLNVSGAANAAASAANTAINAREREQDVMSGARKLSNNKDALVSKSMAARNSGIRDIAGALMPSVSINGVYSSILMLSDDIYIESRNFYQNDVDRSIVGSPLMSFVKLSELSGFTICDNPQIKAGLAIEDSQILNFLSTGFYIE